MTISKKMLVIGLLLSAAGAGHAQLNIEPGTAACHAKPDTRKRCELAWDLSAEPRAYYRVQRLRANGKGWRDAGKPVSTPYASGVDVKTGALYRVLACDDRKFSTNCISSTAAWAVSIKTPEGMPDELEIADGDGTTVVATISKGMDGYGQNSQYNVYLLSDLVHRSRPAELPPMASPAEPGAHGDLVHLVQHNVHPVYEALRAHYAQQDED